MRASECVCVCVCVYTCVCVHTQFDRFAQCDACEKLTHTNTHTNTHTDAPVHTYTCADKHQTYMHALARAQTHPSTNKEIIFNVLARTHMQVLTRAHAPHTDCVVGLLVVTGKSVFDFAQFEHLLCGVSKSVCRVHVYVYVSFTHFSQFEQLSPTAASVYACFVVVDFAQQHGHLCLDPCATAL